MKYEAKKLDLLKKYFGYDNFRNLQQEAIDAILEGQDLLMILPTGGGKSLCYQLPSLILKGLTIVISPLLALMHDQVQALKAIGIKAEMLSSMQNEIEAKGIYNKIYNNELKLLYISPERLRSENFIQTLKKLYISLFVIDEAHCLSEWGHEFRDDYRKLNRIKELFPTTPIAAFTATATKKVSIDIIQNLNLDKPCQFKGVTFRKNLYITAIQRQKNGYNQLISFINNHINDAGIIYTLSRKDTQSLAKMLQEKGFSAKAYHAKLPTQEKNQTFHDFIHDKIKIVVATIAFGMGIDKSNIRFVVHMQLPKSIESYYQEIGRAGRDGLYSQTLLLFSANDAYKREHMMQDLPENLYKQNAFDKLNQMKNFAYSETCRHQNIASYFEDTIAKCKDKCDICKALPIERENISKVSQMYLSTVYRLNQHFGKTHVISVIRGEKTDKILKFKHNLLSVYGIGKEYSKQRWNIIADYLLQKDAVQIGEYKQLLLSAFGIKILKGESKLYINCARLIENKNSQATKRVNSSSISDFKDEHFEILRLLRRNLASEKGVAPYMIFSDKTLKDMAYLLPKTEDEMLKVHGVGELKLQRFGKIFLKAILSMQ